MDTGGQLELLGDTEGTLGFLPGILQRGLETLGTYLGIPEDTVQLLLEDPGDTAGGDTGLAW